VFVLLLEEAINKSRIYLELEIFKIPEGIIRQTHSGISFASIDISPIQFPHGAGAYLVLRPIKYILFGETEPL